MNFSQKYLPGLGARFDFILSVVAGKIKNHLKFTASHKMRSCATGLKSKIFSFTPRPFACKGGGGGVVKLKFPFIKLF